MTTNLFIGVWGVPQTYLYLGDVNTAIGDPTGTAFIINGEGPMGRAGLKGDAGEKGEPGDSTLSDPGDLTLLFDNQLI